jgi:HEAT repeats
MERPTILLVLLVHCAVACADIAPVAGTQPIAPVFEKADLVCNCVVHAVKVVSEQRLGTAPKTIVRQHLSATVEVDDQYKPATAARQWISVEFDQEIPATRASMPALQKGERAVMFLNLAAPSSYVFADPFLAAIPFYSLPQAPGEQGLKKLQAALAAVLQSPNREDQIRAMELLEGFDVVAPDTSLALVPLSRSSDPEVALSAFAVLLKIKGRGQINEAEVLTNLKTYLDSYAGDLEPAALINIGSELGQMGNEKALTALESLAGCRYRSIRLGALSAIRRIRSPQSAPVLVQRLDDVDNNVRYVAVITLAEIFQKYGDYAPGMGLFDKNPGKYVQLWKDWYRNQ